MTAAGSTERRISDLITPAYWRAWDYMRRHLYDEFWLIGGRGSGKSTVAARRIVDDILHDPSVNWVCYKAHQTEIESTCYAEIVKAIGRAGLSGFFRATTSPFRVTYLPTGQRILFRGLDAASKSKGLTVTVGYIAGAWFEEADQFAGRREIDTVLQSVGRGGPNFQVIFTYNPPESPANWVNVEAERPSDRRFVLRTTYLDWNADWLGPFFFRQAEAIRAASEVRYRHEYLGEVTGTGDEIFPRVRPVELSEADIGGLREIRWGMDFGQGDPTVLVGTAYEARRVDGRDIGGVLTVFDEFYRRDARNCEVFEAIASRGLGSTPILGDPGGGGLGVINELRWMGARGIRQAYKPPGSVERGIGWLRECAEIRIDRRRCPNALREFSTYCYDKLRDGTNRNAYPDRDNHAIDAVRYAREAEVFARGGTSRLAGW